MNLFEKVIAFNSALANKALRIYGHSEKFGKIDDLFLVKFVWDDKIIVVNSNNKELAFFKEEFAGDDPNLIIVLMKEGDVLK
jgi:hypothetical protein